MSNFGRLFETTFTGWSLFLLGPVGGVAIADFSQPATTRNATRQIAVLLSFRPVTSGHRTRFLLVLRSDARPSKRCLWESSAFRLSRRFPIPNTVTFAIIAAGLWPQISYCMILFLAGLTAVDPEQIEAGRLDGAKGFRMFWHIIMPQLRPATFIAVVITVVGALRSFDLVQVMTDGGPYGSSSILAYFMFQQSITNFRMGYGAAIAVVLFLIMSIFIAFFLWRMIRTEER